MRTQSDTIGKIVEALCKAQYQFSPIIKDVSAHRHKYAPLDICYNATRKALYENGLVVTQSTSVYEMLDDARCILETTLGHVSGEYFKSYTDLSAFLTSVKGPNPLHTWGSIITYTRRYAYLAIIGAIGQDDDNDGTDVHHKHQEHHPVQYSPSSNIAYTGPSIDKDPYPLTTQLITLIKSSGCDVGEFTRFHGISSRDLESVKKSIDNFDDLLSKFKENKNEI